MNGASPKLQRAARAFLLRLVAENGIDEAVRVLRTTDLSQTVGRGLPQLSFPQRARQSRPIVSRMIAR